MKMYKTRVLVLFSFIVLCKSASFEKHARYEPTQFGDENYKLRSVEYDFENKSYEPSSELTMFGYHMKIGVPKALELLKSEGLQSRIVGGSQVASASVIPHQV